MHHFGQANPKGPGQDDVPSLLRRVAETLDGIARAQVMDLVLHNDATDAGIGKA